MSKFKKGNNGKKMAAISTASLPDIVFMILFFFMVTTVLREVTLQMTVSQPKASEVKKLEKKSLVNYIYIGSPIESQQDKFGRLPCIQLDDKLYRRKDVSKIYQWVKDEQAKKDEKLISRMTTSIKADEDVTMGIVTEVKTQLRKAEALKINYSTKKRE